ncbi:MAG: TIGR00282 family metallophosphoesterase [Sphaerochaetaceae bacterium]|nr:TIGR00282 family metallophosphoesterase [Sphaerochaetaceae bacterium]
MPNKFTTLLLGDVYSDSGCGVILLKLPALRKEYHADFVIANGENACRGFGISVDNMNLLFKAGVDVITSGNHIWQQDEIFPFLDSQACLLRPANYSSSVPGHGYCIVGSPSASNSPYMVPGSSAVSAAGGVAVINIQGRVNMPSTEDPFKSISDCLRQVKGKARQIFVDIHAESGEEKEALAFHIASQVTAVVGTHIHVQTADERILKDHTAFITDLGMCGPSESVIGCDVDLAIKRQKTQLPIKAQAAETPAVIHGVCITSDTSTGKALSIERIVL